MYTASAIFSNLSFLIFKIIEYKLKEIWLLHLAGEVTTYRLPHSFLLVMVMVVVAIMMIAIIMMIVVTVIVVMS